MDSRKKTPLNIWLVAPYFGGSHRAWARGYARNSRHRVTLLTLPARFWKWRMQGGAATLAEMTGKLEGTPDLLLVTDMLNLPAFLGLTRRRLGGVPVLLYCHENQLTYPFPPGEKRDLTYGMINWLSMLAADRILFNSHYHLEDWFGALPSCLKHFPDYTHTHRIREIRSRSEVLPVGCSLARFDRAGAVARGDPPLILWNQRWEYDKNPTAFLQALDRLAGEGVPFRVALAGTHVQDPAEFEAARDRLGERVMHYGRAEPEAYVRLLRQADVVVSTAIHEFFGVAVVEAIYAHTFPVLPRRLAYPELIPRAHHERCLYDDFAGLLARLRWALTHPAVVRAEAGKLRDAVARFDWRHVAPRYDEAAVMTASAQYQ